MKQRTPWTAALVAGLALTAAGCGSASGPGTSSGGSSDKLVVWDWKSGDAKAAGYVEKAKADFAKKHPGVKVEFVAQPFDPSQLGAIEKAIRAADLGLNPANDGKVVRIPIPALTEERRKELSRHVHKLAEEGRNSVRQVRRDANERLKKLLKDHKISEDDEKKGLEEVQKLTDANVRNIDELQKKKDQELLGK